MEYWPELVVHQAPREEPLIHGPEIPLTRHVVPTEVVCDFALNGASLSRRWCRLLADVWWIGRNSSVANRILNVGFIKGMYVYIRPADQSTRYGYAYDQI